MSTFFKFLADWQPVVGAITCAICSVGFILSLSMAQYIRASGDRLAKAMARVYFMDAWKFFITALMGLAAAYKAPDEVWQIIYWARPLILVLLIYSLLSLYKHFKRIGTG